MNIVRGKKKRQKMVTGPVVLTDQYVQWKECDTETHPQVFDLFVLFQFLKEGLEKVGPLDVAWSHTQGVNVSTWKTQGAALHTGATGRCC